MEPSEYGLMDKAEDRMWWYCALHARLIGSLIGVNGVVLDAGCGTGGFLAKLRQARPDLSCVGVEWSAAAAQRASVKSEAFVARADVNSLPFGRSSFDAVISADVLSHAAVNPKRALSEMARVLRPGGRLIINMPAFDWMSSYHDNCVHNARRVSARELRLWLVSAGFLHPRVRYWNGLLLPLVVIWRKLIARGNDQRSDVTPYHPLTNVVLSSILRLEDHIPLMVGASILAVADRPG